MLMNPPFLGPDPQAPLPSSQDYLNLLAEQASLSFQIILTRAHYYEHITGQLMRQIEAAKTSNDRTRLKQLLDESNTLWPYLTTYQHESRGLLRLRRN